MTVRAFAPGRVNLIGDHTDYCGGYALPMAVHLGTTGRLEPGGDTVHLVSADAEDPTRVPLSVGDPAAVLPEWARYVAGVVKELRPPAGGVGSVTSTLPVGAGLSSSAALELAVALALGFQGPPLELARLCQRAEQQASSVPCGIMDQLTSACGVAGHALLLDCAAGVVTPVELPEEVEVVAVHSGRARRLAGSDYASRRATCEEAAAAIGPLRGASLTDLGGIADPVTASRARHVISENARVLEFVAALSAGDPASAGRLMVDSHRSLRDDFEVSTPELDRVVERLMAVPGVYGARLTGAGFGGCAVALVARGTSLGAGWRQPHWRLEAVGGAARTG
ncbi:MAG: galactokinase [Acidimicrobiales bacterium]